MSNNPLFKGNNQQGGTPTNLISQFNQFRQNFTGDPRQVIQQMMNSGRINQAQYNAAVQKAQSLARLFGMK